MFKKKKEETELSASQVGKKPGSEVTEAKRIKRFKKGYFWETTQCKTQEMTTTGSDNMKIVGTLEKQSLSVVVGICFSCLSLSNRSPKYFKTT